MIAPPGMSRRRFVVTSTLAMAALTLRTATSAVTTSTPHVVFDPAITESIRFATAARRQGSACHALSGDRYRFALELLAMADPASGIVGITSYADFLLLTGTLQEARYRLIGHDLNGVTLHGNAAVSWLVKQRSA